MLRRILRGCGMDAARRTALLWLLALCMLWTLDAPIRIGAQPARIAGSSPRVIFDSIFTQGRPPIWPQGSSSSGRAALADGRLLLSTRDGATYTELPTTVPAVGDGTLGATFRVQGRGHWQAGIIARRSRGSGGALQQYLYAIDDRGYLTAAQLSAGGQRLPLFAILTTPPRPNTDQMLGITIRGGTLLFLLNGRQVALPENDPHPLPAGAWGVFVGGLGSGTSVQAGFKQISLIEQPPPVPMRTPVPPPMATRLPASTPWAGAYTYTPTSVIAPLPTNTPMPPITPVGTGVAPATIPPAPSLTPVESLPNPTVPTAIACVVPGCYLTPSTGPTEVPPP